MYPERTFVISLDFRSDRLTNFKAQTASFLPEIEVWPAIHGDTCTPPEIWKSGAGAWGCYRSHMNILEYCLNNNVSSYLVFEDDAQFRPDFDISYRRFMSEVPSDWQQIYLGGQLHHEHTHPPIKVKDNVYRPFNVNRTHAFMLSQNGMLDAYHHLTDLPFYNTEHIDHHLGRWHENPNTKVYCPGRWLVGQMGASSNVSGKTEPITFFNDPESLSLSHPLYDNPICVLYRGSAAPLRKYRHLLHCGNKVDAAGYDITLSYAANSKDPLPEIARWYNWIRSEIVRSNSKALPCLYHPRITREELSQVCPNIIELNQDTIINYAELRM